MNTSNGSIKSIIGLIWGLTVLAIALSGCRGARSRVSMWTVRNAATAMQRVNSYGSSNYTTPQGMSSGYQSSSFQASDNEYYQTAENIRLLASRYSELADSLRTAAQNTSSPTSEYLDGIADDVEDLADELDYLASTLSSGGHYSRANMISLINQFVIVGNRFDELSKELSLRGQYDAAGQVSEFARYNWELARHLRDEVLPLMPY